MTQNGRQPVLTDDWRLSFIRHTNPQRVLRAYRDNAKEE